jgi:hypothetical protein
VPGKQRTASKQGDGGASGSAGVSAVQLQARETQHDWHTFAGCVDPQLFSRAHMCEHRGYIAVSLRVQCVRNMLLNVAMHGCCAYTVLGSTGCNGRVSQSLTFYSPFHHFGAHLIGL